VDTWTVEEAEVLMRGDNPSFWQDIESSSIFGSSMLSCFANLVSFMGRVNQVVIYVLRCSSIALIWGQIKSRECGERR
jgi:hypothetical protein